MLNFSRFSFNEAWISLTRCKDFFSSKGDDRFDSDSDSINVAIWTGGFRLEHVANVGASFLVVRRLSHPRAARRSLARLAVVLLLTRQLFQALAVPSIVLLSGEQGDWSLSFSSDVLHHRSASRNLRDRGVLKLDEKLPHSLDCKIKRAREAAGDFGDTSGAIPTLSLLSELRCGCWGNEMAGELSPRTASLIILTVVGLLHNLVERGSTDDIPVISKVRLGFWGDVTEDELSHLSASCIMLDLVGLLQTSGVVCVEEPPILSEDGMPVISKVRLGFCGEAMEDELSHRSAAFIMLNLEWPPSVERLADRTGTDSVDVAKLRIDGMRKLVVLNKLALLGLLGVVVFISERVGSDSVAVIRLRIDGMRELGVLDRLDLFELLGVVVFTLGITDAGSAEVAKLRVDGMRKLVILDKLGLLGLVGVIVASERVDVDSDEFAKLRTEGMRKLVVLDKLGL